MTQNDEIDEHIGGMPPELQCNVVNNLPPNLRDAVLSGEMRNRLTQEQYLRVSSPEGALGNPSVPPADRNCRPILKLPFEVRRKVFQYLLPDRQNKIVPKAYALYQAHIKAKRAERGIHARRFQRMRQNVAHNLLMTHAGWGVNPANLPPFGPLPPGQQLPLFPAPPHGTMMGQAPVPTQAVHAQGQTVQATLAPGPGSYIPGPGVLGPTPITPGTGIPLAATNSVALNSNAQPNPVVFNPNTQPNVPPGTAPLVTGPQAQVVFNNLHPHNPPPGTVAGNAVPSNITVVHGATVPEDGPANFADDEELQKLISKNGVDPTRECITLNLLCVNQKFCGEVAEILYEEYTFEVHIYDKGVDFLHIPRIDSLETYGMPLEQAMSKFSPTSKFCFQRMKHLEFIFWGGDPKHRTAAIRMQETARKLVEMLKLENNPLSELTVRLEMEPTTWPVNDGEEHEYWDEIGNFWVNQIEQRARKSILNAKTNLEFVCKPFEELRAIKAALVLPVGLEDDFDINTYKAVFESAITVDQKAEARDAEVANWIREHEEKLAEAAKEYDYEMKYTKAGFNMDESEDEDISGLTVQGNDFENTPDLTLPDTDNEDNSSGSSSQGNPPVTADPEKELHQFPTAEQMYFAAKRRQEHVRRVEPALLTEQDLTEDVEIDEDDEEEEEPLETEHVASELHDLDEL
jgi:hypothetical protein